MYNTNNSDMKIVIMCLFHKIFIINVSHLKSILELNI